MFWDCSWVQNNIVNGKNYGTHAFELLRGIANPPTEAPSTQAPPTTPQTTTCTSMQSSTSTQKPTTLQTTKPQTQRPIITTKPPTGKLPITNNVLYLLKQMKT